MTQKDEVRRALKDGNKISPLSALRDFGTLRLAAIIYELRREGLRIDTDYRNQGNKRYAVYRLAK